MFEFLNEESMTETFKSEGILKGKINSYASNTGIPAAGGGELVLYADSLDAFFNHLKEHMATPRNSGSSDSEKSGNFYKLNNYREAADIFLNRPETIRSFSVKDDDAQVPNTAGSDVEYDTWGDFLDVGRFLEGVPEVMGQMIMGNPLGLFATITVNLNAVCYVDEATINKRASRILRLVDWLESQNIRCSISGVSSTGCKHLEVKMKEHGDTFDINSLAVLTHSDFFRRMCFRVAEYSETWRSGYGMPYYFSDFSGERKIPELGGYQIDLDWFKNSEDVDRPFDALEANLKKAIEEENRTFKATVTEKYK